jgi:hypothetical protein
MTSPGQRVQFAERGGFFQFTCHTSAPDGRVEAEAEEAEEEAEQQFFFRDPSSHARGGSESRL